MSAGSRGDCMMEGEYEAEQLMKIGYNYCVLA